MSDQNRPARQTPRVTLRHFREARFDHLPVLLIELGTGGAKLEHRAPLAVGSLGSFAFDSITVRARICYSLPQPGEIEPVYHSGVAFEDLTEVHQDELLRILLGEAQEQVHEWDSDVQGLSWQPARPSMPAYRSATTPCFLALHFNAMGWTRRTTSDPNQPYDGLVVLEDTPEEEILLLCSTYEAADDRGRDFLRRLGMESVLELFRSRRNIGH